MIYMRTEIIPTHRSSPRCIHAAAEAAVCAIGVLSAVFFFMGMGWAMAADAQVKKFWLKAPTAYFEKIQSLALLHAALAGDLAKARGLVAEGADPNDEGPTQDANANRLRLLHYAIASNNKPAVRILISVGADPELVAQHNGRAFLFAVTLNNIEMLSVLLDMRPIQSLSRETLRIILFESVSQGRAECLALLLDRGAPIDFRSGAKDTLLMGAMSTEDFDLAEQLILRGASINIDTPSGVTPAYQVERMLGRYAVGSKTYLKLQRVKNLMIERGAIFPATDPVELRERRKGGGNVH